MEVINHLLTGMILQVPETRLSIWGKIAPPIAVMSQFRNVRLAKQPNGHGSPILFQGTVYVSNKKQTLTQK